MNITPAKKRSYIKTKGTECLNCGSGDYEKCCLENSRSGEVTQQVCCNDCRSEWIEIYHLADVEKSE